MNRHILFSEVKLFTVPFVLAVSSYACSSSDSVRSTDYGKMNEALKGQNVEIVLKDGRVLSAKEVKISDDSASWVSQRTGEESRASIREINKIVNKKHLLRDLEGLGFGLVGGGGIGALLIGAADTHQGELGGHGGEIGLVLGGGLGTLIGVTTGLIVGHRYNYEFTTTGGSDSLRNEK